MINICFLTEGGKNTGYGHITRCSALYEAFEELNCIPQMIINGEESLRKQVSGKKVRFTDWLKNPHQLPVETDIIVVDSYQADYPVYKNLSEKYACAVFFDDNRRINYPKGIVVNGSVLAKELVYPSGPEITYLLGSNYTPLRKIFWKTNPKVINKNINSILITTGGDDSRNLIPAFMDLFSKNHPEIFQKILVTSSFGNLNEIKSRVNDKIELIENPDAHGIKEIMQQVDFAISSAGQSLYELARMGVPTIAIQVADNQKENVSGWLKAGFIEFAGDWNDDNLEHNILHLFNKLGSHDERKLKSETGQKWMNGRGALKVAKKVLQNYFNDKICLRKAEINDAKRIYDLSNDNEVRKSSFNQVKILYPEHLIWFERQLKNTKCLFLVTEFSGKLVGQIRFEIKTDAIISISISKEFRNIGIGEVLMSKAIRFLIMEYPAVDKVVAFVKNENSASKTYFEKCNFKFVQSLLINETPSVQYHLHLEKRHELHNSKS